MELQIVFQYKVREVSWELLEKPRVKRWDSSGLRQKL